MEKYWVMTLQFGEVHLNQIDPDNTEEQKAFKAAALSVACLLNLEFEVGAIEKVGV